MRKTISDKGQEVLVELQKHEQRVYKWFTENLYREIEKAELSEDAWEVMDTYIEALDPLSREIANWIWEKLGELDDDGYSYYEFIHYTGQHFWEKD